MTKSFVLKAIDGSNPLGFLAALGTLRLASLHWPGRDVLLSWHSAGTWMPTLSGVPVSEPRELCQALVEAPCAPVAQFSPLGKNITVSPEQFRWFAKAAQESALRNERPDRQERPDRRLADFAAAFGCEDCPDDKNERIRRTQLCFITGSGHQDFLGTIAALQAEVTALHLSEALFDGWQCNNKGLAFRWDPSDAREYALRWTDPSKEGAWTTWGANRLAFEGLPFFSTQPQASGLATTGFPRRRKKRREEFTWPLWQHPLGCDEITSLVGLRELQRDPMDTGELRSRGISEIFRSTRVHIGQGANFKVSFRPARAM